jgi:hypothetical protein
MGSLVEDFALFIVVSEVRVNVAYLAGILFLNFLIIIA